MNKKHAVLLSILAIVTFGLVVFFTIRPIEMQDDLQIVFDDEKNTLIQPQEATDLFVHNAQVGSFEKVEGEDDVYILTLTDFDDDVIYFTDRPLRDVGRVKLAQFLNGLGFEIGDPPNAAIVMEMENGEDITIVVELTSPILNRDTNELIYTATILHDEDDDIAEYGADQLPENFVRATMLIDGCSKKNEKFCGSTGQCYDPKKEECGGVATWKKEKDKKCHGMKLEDAYKYANGKDSECLLYDKASLSQIDYKCDDSIKGWKIGLDVNFKGEQNNCNSHCIIVAAESEKDGEGVARIEYKCDKSSDEKEPKNKYCPKLDLNKGHDKENAVDYLIDKYQDILAESQKHHTSYEHHYCVTSGMPYPTKKHWATDCSGLGGFALFETLPYHYKLLDDDRSAWKKADRPLATDFYNFIDKQKTEFKEGENECWMKIEKLEDAQRGDFLVVAYDSRAKSNSTGHVMWIDREPQKDGEGRYNVRVIDSANNGHAHDTRHDGNTYNCEDSKDCGIGRGDMWFDANKDGEPIFYRWSHKDGKKYCKYEDTEHCNCDDDKCELKGIVIGRVLDCKVKK
jgi:hypothetical protein